MKLSRSLLLLLSTSYFLFSSNTPWEYNQVIGDIRFDQVRYAMEGGERTSIYGKLAEDTAIGGFPCAADWVSLTTDYQVLMCRLSKNLRILKIELPKDTWVFMNKDSSMTVVFPRNTIVGKILCRGGGGVKGVQTSFYANGQLKSLFSPEDVEIDHVLCRGGLLAPIEFNEAGRLKRCKSAAHQEINGTNYRRNDLIDFEH
jgi:hypothetical protein